METVKKMAESVREALESIPVIEKKDQLIQSGTNLTTAEGKPEGKYEDSIKIGGRGTVLMEDLQLLEKLQHFDRERIPERVVHATGAGAHGTFTVTHSLSDITKASLFSRNGKQTEVFVRFSQVNGSRGSADTVRDVRGFATKFYTDEGNYDLVGNNIPVFFIRDGILFPDLVHSFKPYPRSFTPQATTAHDSFWDFVSLKEESAHMLTWLFSSRGLAKSYRLMEGFGVNTFILVNEHGKATYVKFHWKPHLGVQSLSFPDGVRIAGESPDFLKNDLWQAIERKQYPKWDLCVQLIPVEMDKSLPFDPLDVTKIWPEEQFPLRKVGVMELNANPVNYFAEVEQVTFSPAHLVPGILPSDDPLLQTRLFSYKDTHMHRVGVNSPFLPINRAKCPVHNFMRDGHMNFMMPTGGTTYYPNSDPSLQHLGVKAEKGAKWEEMVEGRKTTHRDARLHGDNYSQARMRWEKMDLNEKADMVSAFSYELSCCLRPEVRDRVIMVLKNISEDLGNRVNVSLQKRLEGHHTTPEGAPSPLPLPEEKLMKEGMDETKSQSDKKKIELLSKEHPLGVQHTTGPTAIRR